MKRILLSDLEGIVKRINDLTHSPSETYIKTPHGKFIAQVGNYHLSGAYGGYSLHRITGEGGGSSDVLACGHVSKRELYHLMHAFMRGMDA